MKLKLLFTMLISFTFSHCTYHNEDEYFKDNADICYTDDMSFSNDIFPVIKNNCYSCHNNTNTSYNVNLENYNNIKQIAESGRLLGAIKHNDGFYSMPLNQEKLPECTISKIEAWINQGLKNN